MALLTSGSRNIVEVFVVDSGISYGGVDGKKRKNSIGNVKTYI